MTVETHRLTIETRGSSHVVDLTGPIEEALAGGSIRDGIATVFAVGSTAGITTTEFEPGLAGTDLREAFEKIAPADAPYAHEATWDDDNGHSHVRASLLGPSITVPIVGGRPVLGTWQQVVLIDFDTRPRTREVVVQVLGERG
jgi:secondary thiamine-phosphate synthase enzyme